MGPPPIGGGEATLEAKAEKLPSASMGPPPIGGGEALAWVAPMPGYEELQWGRRPSAAERRALPQQPRARASASMGPPPIGGGEGVPPVGVGCGHPGFNGAAAHRRRRAQP